MATSLAELKINDLSDKCLVNIFDCLPFLDKFKIDEVCKKWQCLNHLSWKNVKHLDTREIVFPNINLLFNVIKECGKYLTDLDIIITEDSNYIEIFEEMSKNCMNITKLTIYDRLEKNAGRLYTDFHLGLLFKKNPKIYSITLCGLKLNGSCFLGLNFALITELSIEFCKFETFNNLNIFSELKNLKKFHWCSIKFDDASNGVIDALNNGNCENLQDVCVTIFNQISSDKLLMLLSKQKKLLKLHCMSSFIKVNRHFFQNLSLDNITDLEIRFGEDALNFSKELKNLENLYFSIENLTDQFLDNLSIKCENLKNITIVFEKYSITANSENYFSRLQKLEIFELYNDCKTKQMNSNVDCILKSLSHCQNLKCLLLHKCEFTNTGAEHLSSLLNLTALHFCDSEITESQLIFILTNLNNLNVLKLIQCKNVNSHFIFELINKIKTHRQDKHILQVIFYHKLGFTFNDLPLLQILSINLNCFH